MIKNYTKKFYLLVGAFVMFAFAKAQNSNGSIDAPGDIAIVAYHNDDDGFSFILLDDALPNTTIVFTDEEWDGTAFVSPTGEGEVTWINNSGVTISKGTVIIIQDADDNSVAGIQVNQGSATESDSGFNINALSEQLYAFIGTRAAPQTFLAFYGDLSGGAPSSLANTGLTIGATAHAATSGNIEGYYTGSTSCNGTAAQCAAQFNDPNNWTNGDFNYPVAVQTMYNGSVFAPAVTEPTVPTLSADPSSVCVGETSEITISGSLNDATQWVVYTGSCGGTQIGTTTGSTFTVTPSSPSTTYFVRGEGSSVTPGSCGSITINTTAADDASFSYSAAAFCASDTDPTPTITGLTGGTFSSTTGLSINASTGSVDVSASTPGTYTVTYTTAGTCPNSSNVAITINAADDASFSYSAAAFCGSDTDPTPTITGLAGGTFSSTTGLSINASTGAVDVSASTPGTYTVTYTTAGTCPNSSNVAITINAADDANFSYSAAAFCASDTDPTPTITGLAGGTFSSTIGLSINASTGALDVSASTPGAYTVTYTTTGTCPNSSNTSLEIKSTPEPTNNNGDVNTINVTFTGGCVSIDGRYVLNGTLNGKNNYEFESDPTYQIGFDGTKWVLYAVNDLANTGFENTNDGLGDLPPTDGWISTQCGGGTMDIELNEGSFCEGDTIADLAATLNGTNLQLYNAANGGSSLSSTELLANGEYYATSTANGCESVRVQITVSITPSTTFTAPADICIDAGIQTGLSGGIAAGGVYSGPGVTDDGNGSTYSFDPEVAGVGTHTIVYATNTNGCADSASDTIVVSPLEDASFSYSTMTFCPNGTDPLPTVTGTSGGTFSSTTGLVIDSSTGAIDLKASTLGDYVVTYITSGVCNGSSSVNITINDTTAPVADVALLADVTAECSVATLVAPTASDNCGGTVTVANNATLPITTQGTTVVTWTFEDEFGNKSTQTQNVVINDTIAPVADVAVLADVTAQCSVAALVAPTATDNCGGMVTVSNDADLPITDQGTTVVTWTFEDEFGNKSNQTQNVVINDTTAPVADVAVLADVTAQCSVAALVAPTATDNCGGTVTVTNNATLPITAQGTTVVTWSFDDGNGNVSTQTQNVVIDDVTAPVPDVVILADVTAECSITTLVAPTATDNCSGTVTVTSDAVLPITAQGTTVVTWTYDDGNGNTSTQTQNVIIDDVTAPVADVAVLADVTAECSITTLVTPTATDNCGGTVTVTGDAVLPIIAQGTTVVTWTYDDGNGNTSTQTQNVIIDDLTAPVADVAVLADITAQCSITTLVAPTATDNCGGTVSVTSDAVLPITAQGTTVVTWTYDDGNGNTTIQTQNVIIDDVTAPVADVAVLADVTAECSIITLVAPTATDNCGGTVTVTGDAVLPIIAQGTTVVTWTYDDGNGNTSTQTQNVIIDDLTAPVADVAVLADITAQCSITTLVAPTATDNCGGTVSVTSDAVLPITAQGTTVVTWTYDDGNGNTTIQTQNVIIDDVTAPVADVAVLADVTAECSITTLVTPTATDNCGGTVTVTGDAVLPIIAQGTTVVTWTYDDGNGNTSTQTQNVIIDDLTAPVADVAVLADVTAECSITTLVTPTATDNCGGTVSVTSDAVLPITAQGTTVVTWTYDDGNGNTTIQTQNVIIDDVTAPVADVAVLADVTAECSIITLVAPTATDNCGGTVTVTGDAVLPIIAQGTTVVTWTYDDGNGNTSTQTQNVIIDDVTAPVADVAVLADITAQCSITTLVAPTATDNCGGTVSVTSDAVLPITAQGTTVVTWTYDDGNGNTTIQTQNVIIDDVTAPVADVAVLADVTAECSIITLVAPTATDNCSGTVTVTGDAVLPIIAQGTTVVTWTYDDGNGNTSTQTQNVIIDDVTAPVADVAVLADITAQCSITTLVAPTATDNCGGTVSVTSDAVLPITAQGTTVVTWTYDDGNGNTTIQTQNVIIAGSDIDSATLADATFVYDGSVRSLAVENIPADATVTYTNNDQSEAGIYNVTATVTSASPDCPQVTLNATLIIEQAEQVITFAPLSRRRLNTDPDFQLTAASSSGLPVTYDSVPLTNPAAAQVSTTGFVTLEAEGFVLITASQEGSNNYLPAEPVNQELEVFLNTDTTIESIVINGQIFSSPATDIFYLIECDDSISNVFVEVNSTTGATFSTGTSFTVETATPGLYRRTIVVTAENGRDTRSFNLLIEKRFVFDAIVEQKYGNTLVVNNNPANNGGYSFVAYQWFKNGRLVSTEQFFSEGDNASDQLDPTARYSVRMTLANGDVLQTCESTVSLGNRFTFSILQNPVIEKTLKLRADYPEADLNNAQYHIFDQNGRLVKSQISSSREITIYLPDNLPVGVYRVVLQTNRENNSLNFINN